MKQVVGMEIACQWKLRKRYSPHMVFVEWDGLQRRTRSTVYYPISPCSTVRFAVRNQTAPPARPTGQSFLSIPVFQHIPLLHLSRLHGILITFPYRPFSLFDEQWQQVEVTIQHSTFSLLQTQTLSPVLIKLHRHTHTHTHIHMHKLAQVFRADFLYCKAR